jgi:hypothetical protein
MSTYWLNPWYWVSRHYVKQFVELIEARPSLMENPKVRADLAWIVEESRRLGWAPREQERAA